MIDDPESILKCTNKVFLAELLERNRVPTPRTLIVHRGNRSQVSATLGFPCILKQPDSSFSRGVVKVETEAACKEAVGRLLEKSELVIAQEFLPTTFDWRVGIFDRQPLYACRYYMAKRHWQILKHDGGGKLVDEGRFDTIPVEHLPTPVLRTALKAANLIGDGLYGVDLKQVGDKVYVIEVNDNPNLDAGVEDQILKDDLYLRIMRVMLRRVEQRKERLIGMRRPLRLFEGYGVEIEYMIVDRDTLAVLPVADRVLSAEAGELTDEVAVGELAWSNELVLHVIELKTNGPAPSLVGLDRLFQDHVRRINDHLAPLGGMLLPGGMHPAMDPLARPGCGPTTTVPSTRPTTGSSAAGVTAGPTCRASISTFPLPMTTSSAGCTRQFAWCCRCCRRWRPVRRWSTAG